MDRLRLDKYLFLIRCYVGVGFEVFLKQNSETGKGGKKGEKKRKREAESNKQGNKKKKSKRNSDAGKEQENDEENREEEIEAKYPGLASYISIFEEGPLYPFDFDPDQEPTDDGAGGSVPIPHGPDGLRYHIMDLWIDELEKVFEFEEVESAGEDEEATPQRKIKGDVPMDLLLRPIETLRVKGMHKPVRTRATEALDDERLVEWGVKERKVEKNEDESEDEWGGFGDD